MTNRLDTLCIYILTNKRYGTLYVGLTTNPAKRVDEHKTEAVDGFTKDHGLKKLVYYELHNDIREAAHRERLLKKWRRAWKIRLIEESNPDWADLYDDLKRKVNL